MGIWGVITLGLSWLLAAQVAALETPQVAALAKTRALPGDEHIKAMADAMRQLAANLDGLKFDPPEPVGTGVKSDLGEGLQVPPAPPPGPAPNDVTQALLEAQASADEKKEQAKMYVKPPGCRPTTSAELRDYAGYKTNCARLQRQTPVSLKVTNLKVTQISEAREEISVVLTLHLSWMDPAIATHSVESLWSPNIDFLDVVKKRMVGNPSYQTSADNVISMRQVYELIVKNRWDFSKYPFDTQELMIKMLAPVLTEKTEPITVGTNSLKAGNSVDEFKLEEFSVKVSGYGLAQGPGGSWGNAQQVQMRGDAKRKLAKPMFGSILPIFFTPLIAYSGFFLASEQIIARVTLGGVSLLAIYILYAPANFSDGMVGFGLDTWLSWFSLLQSLCVCVSIVAHAVSHKLLCQDDAEKSANLDTAFKILFPLISASTIFAAYTISYWKSSESVPMCIGLVAIWSAAVVLVLFALGKKAKIDIAKSKDFPGI